MQNANVEWMQETAQGFLRTAIGICVLMGLVFWWLGEMFMAHTQFVAALFGLVMWLRGQGKKELTYWVFPLATLGGLMLFPAVYFLLLQGGMDTSGILGVLLIYVLAVLGNTFHGMAFLISQLVVSHGTDPASREGLWLWVHRFLKVLFPGCVVLVLLAPLDGYGVVLKMFHLLLVVFLVRNILVRASRFSVF